MISFRDATIANSVFTQVAVTAATSVVVSSGSALGCAASTACIIYPTAINNAGTVELGVVGQVQLDESVMQTSVAEGGTGTADSGGTLYSTTLRSAKAVITPGALFVWTAAPTNVWNLPAYPIKFSALQGAEVAATVSNTTFAQIWDWTNTSGASLTIQNTQSNSAGSNLTITNSATGSNASKGLVVNMNGTSTGYMGIDVSITSAGANTRGIRVVSTSAAPPMELQTSGSLGSAGFAGLIFNNVATAQNDQNAGMLFQFKRTTTGVTDIARIEGQITDIQQAAYKGVITFKTANNAAPTEHLRIDHAGHLKTTGTAPTVTACGSSPGAVAGTDVNGRVTIGTSASSSCTVTFAVAYATAPVCTVVDETAATALKAAPTTTTIVITGMADSDHIAWICLGY